MDNIIDFKPRKVEPKVSSTLVFDLSVYRDSDGMYEVYMDMTEGFTDNEVFDALFCAAMKFADDHGLTEEFEIDLEDLDDD